MQATDLTPSADDAAQLLAAMANEKRLMILCHLVDQERSVNDIAKLVDLGQSPLSQHLGKLRALKLVKTRRDGQQILYSLASDKVSRILVALYGIYCTTDAKPAA